MKRQILGPVREGRLSKEQGKKIVQDVAQRSSQHAVPAEQGGWNVKRGGGVKTTKHFDNKQEAIG
jgi:polyhydroxyalkanoate synthesis regulator phasin